jgi:serine/threonine protein kinase
VANADQTQARGAPGPRSLVNQTLGQFQIKDELGRGGMAVVYKGYQPSLDRWVAIKTLPAEMTGDRDMVSRFHREAEAMVALNHSNIVQIIDKGQDQGLYYFAMEFVEGPSLKDLLKQESMSMDLLFDICVQVADGLAYAHKKGIVHRDIKPANILYEKTTGLAKVADFGIARVTNKEMDMITLTAQNVGMGTMNYMAPEQKTDAKAVDHRADIYSLGVMIYEMFTGKLPLGRFKMPSQLNSKLPRKLDEVLAKCLETDPADRFPTMEALREELQLAREAAKGGGTIVRSVRDAAERTLTAMGAEGGKGKLFACCFAFLLLAGGAGAAFVAVDPMKLDLLAKVGLKKGGGPTTTTETTSEKPPTTTSEKPPATTTSEKAPTTTSERPPATTTSEKPPATTTSEKPPATTTSEKPPATTTSEKPPATTTSEQPPATTTSEKPPATTTSERPPATTTSEQPPATTTSEKPPATTTSEKPPATTTETPGVKRLTDVQLARYNELSGDLSRELAAFERAAERAGLTGLEAALAEARTAAEAAVRQKDEGAPDAVVALERARDGLRQAARVAFKALVERLVRTVREEGGDPRELESIDGDYVRLGSRPVEEQATGWAEVVRRLHGLRVVRLQRSAQTALELAELRGDASALRERFDAALGLDAVAGATAFEGVHAAAVALEGPTPTGLREVAKDFVAAVTGDTSEPFFYSICAAPGGGLAALGPVSGEKKLLLCAVNAQGKLRATKQAAVPLDNPTYVAAAGGDAYWIAEFNGSVVHRYRFAGNRLVEDGGPLETRDTIFDLDVAPDGTLHVATLREVRAYRDGVLVGAATRIERDFAESIFAPRRVAALVGGGFVVTGHVAATLPGGAKLWEAEKDWTLTLRALLPGDERPRQYQPRDRNLSAVAACGGGFLAAQHALEGGDLFFVSRQLEPSPTGLVRGGSKPELAQDLVVSGRRVYVLEKQASRPNFRRRLVAYEME